MVNVAITPLVATVRLTTAAPITLGVTPGVLTLSANAPRVTVNYSAPPQYLLPAAASIPIPSPGAYYLLPSKAA